MGDVNQLCQNILSFYVSLNLCLCSGKILVRKMFFFCDSFFKFLIAVCWPQIDLGSVSSRKICVGFCSFFLNCVEESVLKPQGTVVYFEGRLFIRDSVIFIDVRLQNFFLNPFGKLCFSRTVSVSLRILILIGLKLFIKFPHFLF